MQERTDHGQFADAPPHDGQGPGDDAEGPPGISLDAFWALVDPDRGAPDA